MDEGKRARDDEGGHGAVSARELEGEEKSKQVERSLHPRREDAERIDRGEPGHDEDRRERRLAHAPREPVSEEGAGREAGGANREGETSRYRDLWLHLIPIRR